jgi:hypothetical protein
MKRKESDSMFASRRRRGSSLAALAVLLLAAPVGLTAERNGSTLRLDLLDGRQLQGELLAVKGEILILQAWSGTEAKAGICDVARVQIMRRNRVGEGLVSGLVTGIAVGSLIALPFTLSRRNEYSVIPLMFGWGMFGGIGAVIGAAAGFVLSADETIQCQGRDDSRRVVVLKRLRRLARFGEDEGPVAAERPGLEVAAAVPRFLPRKAEFRRWSLGVTFAQSPPTYTEAALALARGFRYAGPVSPGTEGSAQMSDENESRAWVGLREIRCDFYLGRHWTIGILFDPLPGRGSVYGARELRIAGKDTQSHWDMDIKSRTYFLAASYAILAADGFLRQNEVRLSAGLGWNRSSFQYWEYAHESNPADSLDPVNFFYRANSDLLLSSSLGALVKAEAAHHFNSRWSLALDAGFRYVPLRISEQEVTGRITRQAPLASQDCILTIPRGTLNVGGFFLGLSLGYFL